jgi:hypothetical protein
MHLRSNVVQAYTAVKKPCYSFSGRSGDTAEVSRGPSSQDGGLPVPVRVLSQTTGPKAAHEKSCQVRQNNISLLSELLKGT